MIMTIEHKVGDTVYQITTFTTSKGMRILKTLLGLFGPSLAEVFGSINPTEMSIDESAFSKAMQLFVNNLDKVEVESVAKDMCAGVLKGGQPILFDTEFAGNYGALMSVLTRIVKENYASFFGDGGFGSFVTLIQQHKSNVALPPSQS